MSRSASQADPEARIPLHLPPIEAEDVQAVLAALRSGDLLAGDGPHSRELAELARSELGVPWAFPTPSGSQALELALRSLPLEPGDEVVCPSFTFVSVANAAILAGGTVVFAEIDDETLNLDPDDAASRIGPRTRAVVPGHYAGIARGLDELEELAGRHGLQLVEDAAHALGGSFRGRPLGTWGVAGAFSFHGTKNLVAGEGGMLVVRDDELARRVEVVREKGTDRSRFFRGEVDRYTWQELGSSYLMGDLLCALVVSQWRRKERIQEARRVRFHRYMDALEGLEDAGDVILPTVPDDCEPAWHLFYLRTTDPDARDALLQGLRGAGIEASFHFVPLHLSPYARRHLGTGPGDLPVTERAADTLVRLPLFPQLGKDDQGRVVDALHRHFGRTAP